MFNRFTFIAGLQWHIEHLLCTTDRVENPTVHATYLKKKTTSRIELGNKNEISVQIFRFRSNRWLVQKFSALWQVYENLFQLLTHLFIYCSWRIAKERIQIMLPRCKCSDSRRRPNLTWKHTRKRKVLSLYGSKLNSSFDLSVKLV